jgi:hypothetical protein
MNRFLTLLVAAFVIVPAAASAPPLTAQKAGWVAKLVAPGDRLELAYGVQGTKSPTGTLYVRSDAERSFRALLLFARGSELRIVVPVSLIHGRKLLYHALIRDPATGRSVRIPAGGAEDVAWVLQHPVVVRLGTHRFGRTRPADAVVARAKADQVGWQSEGDPSGPQTFLVGRDRSIWLHDAMNHRLLVWRAGRPGAPARSVTLPFLIPGAEDVALGPAGTIYFDRDDREARRLFVYRMDSATGKVLWRTTVEGEVGGNTQLRVSPDGTLYAIAADLGWVPVATPAGRPLSPFEQRRGAGLQPTAGGLRLVAETYAPYAGDSGRHPDPREVRVALIDRSGRLVRAWRVVSRTAINLTGFFTPALVGGAPVVSLDATAGRDQNFKWEYVVLRLGPKGATTSFSLRHAVYGESLFADLRVGPDGALYQLSSSPASGVTIGRYSVS